MKALITGITGQDGSYLAEHLSRTTKLVYWMVTIVLDPKFYLSKERLMEKMSERNIDCRPFFHPLSSIPAYRDTEQARLARARNQVSYCISPYGLNLPSALNMTKEKVRVVCATLREILQGSATAARGAETK